MSMSPGIVAGLMLGLSLLPARAAEVISVNAMNYPAWVIREFQTVPLAPGAELRANDLIRTGKDGRILLQMADGSAVKLGESVRFVIQSARLTQDQGQLLLESTFQTLRGAFRFTSAFFGAASTGHRVNVDIGAITAGVRGTDIWGRSNPEQDLVCLIEGAIDVSATGQAPLTMDQALSFYVKPKGEAALPVKPVDMVQLQGWAAETELDPDAGIATRDGEWQLVLLSLSDSANADNALRNFHQQGFAVERRTVQRQGRTLHRLLLRGFVSIEAALNARRRIVESLGIRDAWVWKAGR